MLEFDEAQRQQQNELLEEGPISFKLRGKEFHVRRVVPYAVVKRISGVRNVTTDFEVYDAFEKAVLGLLATPEDRERFLDVLYDESSDFPITYLDVLDIQSKLIQEVTRRPPTQPASSSESSSTNGSNETATSSDEPDEASTA